MKTVPSTIHKNTGSQPQHIAIHGPSIGARPAIEVNGAQKEYVCL